jgi:hypothetical protein
MNTPNVNEVWLTKDKVGNELGATDVGDSFLGDYDVKHEGVWYSVEVKATEPKP